MENTNNALTKIYPNGLTGKEIIRRITEVYHAGYDLNNLNFDIYEQLLACEAIAEAEKEEGKTKKNFTYLQKEIIGLTNDNTDVNGVSNDSYKRKVNFELTESKLKIIEKLKECNYQTPPVETAQYLEEFFREQKSPSNFGPPIYVSFWNVIIIEATL